VKLPLALFVLAFVSFFPQSTTALGDRLAFVGPAHQILAPAASWLARYDWIGALCLVSGIWLVYRRLTDRHEKKLLEP
jgi:hypothetical protein